MILQFLQQHFFCHLQFSNNAKNSTTFTAWRKPLAMVILPPSQKCTCPSTYESWSQILIQFKPRKYLFSGKLVKTLPCLIRFRFLSVFFFFFFSWITCNCPPAACDTVTLEVHKIRVTILRTSSAQKHKQVCLLPRMLVLSRRSGNSRGQGNTVILLLEEGYWEKETVGRADWKVKKAKEGKLKHADAVGLVLTKFWIFDLQF